MPKVRASSATMGTMRLPSVESLSNCARICTNAMVVDCSRVFEPSSIRANCESAGTSSFGAIRERAGR